MNVICASPRVPAFTSLQENLMCGSVRPYVVPWNMQPATHRSDLDFEAFPGADCVRGLHGCRSRGRNLAERGVVSETSTLRYEAGVTPEHAPMYRWYARTYDTSSCHFAEILDIGKTEDRLFHLPKVGRSPRS